MRTLFVFSLTVIATRVEFAVLLERPRIGRRRFDSFAVLALLRHFAVMECGIESLRFGWTLQEVTYC